MAPFQKKPQLQQTMRAARVKQFEITGKAAADIERLVKDIALAFRSFDTALSKAMASVPPNSPWAEASLSDGWRLRRADISTGLIERELALASAAHDVRLPGGEAGAVEPAKLLPITAATRELAKLLIDPPAAPPDTSHVSDEFRALLRDIGAAEILADPARLIAANEQWVADGCPARRKPRPYYIEPGLREGQAPPAIPLPNGGWGMPTADEYAAMKRPRVVFLDEISAPQGSPTRPDDGQRTAGRAASAAHYRAAGFAPDGSPLHQSAPPPVTPLPTTPGASYTPALDHFSAIDASAEMAAASRRLSGDIEPELLVTDEPQAAVAGETGTDAATSAPADGTPASVAATADPPSTEGAGAPEDAAAVTDTPNPDTAPSGAPARRLGGFTRR